MNTKTHSNSISALALFATAVAALVFSMNVSRAHAATIFDITFPIAELGSCTDKDACKAYCTLEANQDACEQFAADHGITTAPKSVGEDRAKAVQGDGGPGKCAVGAKDPQASCKAYCDSTDHIDECVSYGKEHGLLVGQQLIEAEKVRAALKGGAKLPEGCTNQSSCKAICENPSTISQAKSCFAFGKAAGLLPDDFDESRAEKVFQAIQDGTAPFKSPKEFQRCERPEDEATLKKCVDFAVRNGMMTEEQATIVQKTGGKGPGGCFGERECHAYCEEHQEECFQFSKENGLIKPEQEEQMRRGAEEFKQNLDRVPEAVRTCLASSIGQEALDAIASGSTVPNRALGEKMRACFEQNRPMGDDQQGRGPEGAFDPNQGEQGRFMGPPEGTNASSSGRTFENRGTYQPMAPNRPQQMPSGIPPQVKECLVQKYGEAVLQKLSQGPAQGEFAEAVRTCFKDLFGENAAPNKDSTQGQSFESQPGFVRPTNQYPQPPMPQRPGEFQNTQSFEGTQNIPPMMQKPPFPEGQMPPEGFTGSVPPAGTMYVPPQGFEGSVPPPTTDTGDSVPPPPAPTSPTSLLDALSHPISFLANVLSALTR
ncbi:MAG: hypothetical protein WAV50_02165 [Minisyncoccia bacterium]